MSVTTILEKIDTLSLHNEIADVSQLAQGLLELQHRRFPHLVPMYRTVHRTVPRRKVFRAIRWVNPKRMFPGAGLTKEEMMKMSTEELTKLAVTLNTYREEAHVIHNRYNQMIWLIERGQSPYYIPYANIAEPTWLKLEGYLGRAERLKDGTMDWERTLDQQAQDLRSVLLTEEHGKTKFDDIDGLWEAPDGSKRAPMFGDVKRKKGTFTPLRTQRTKDGKREKPVTPDIFPRQFLEVNPDEIRQGEVVRFPHNNLVRVPPNQEFLSRDKLNFKRDRVPANRIANRREQRVSQRRDHHGTGAPPSIGPGGRHRGGGPSGGPVPVQPPPQQERRERSPDELSAIQQRINDSRDWKGPTPVQATLREMNSKRQSLLEKWGATSHLYGEDSDPTTGTIEAGGYTGGGSTTGEAKIGAGGVRAATNFTLMIDGKAWIHKIVKEENRGELFSYLIDRALNLNISPALYMGNRGGLEIGTALANTHGTRLDNATVRGKDSAKVDGNNGGGHFQEFCDNCVAPDSPAGTAILRKMAATKEGRAQVMSLHMLDMLTGNGDRHRGNYLLNENGSVVAIDNSYVVGKDRVDAQGNPTQKHITELNDADYNVQEDGGPYDLWPSQKDRWVDDDIADEYGAPPSWDGGNGGASVEQEANEFFDQHFLPNIEKMKEGVAAANVQWANAAEYSEFNTDAGIEKFRKAFLSNMKNTAFRHMFENFGTKGQGDY